jgi:hypothetical protein
MTFDPVSVCRRFVPRVDERRALAKGVVAERLQPEVALGD